MPAVVPDSLQYMHGFVGLPSVFNPFGWIEPISPELTELLTEHWSDKAIEIDEKGRFHFDLETWDDVWIDTHGFDMAISREN